MRSKDLQLALVCGVAGVLIATSFSVSDDTKSTLIGVPGFVVVFGGLAVLPLRAGVLALRERISPVRPVFSTVGAICLPAVAAFHGLLATGVVKPDLLSALSWIDLKSAGSTGSALAYGLAWPLLRDGLIYACVVVIVVWLLQSQPGRSPAEPRLTGIRAGLVPAGAILGGIALVALAHHSPAAPDRPLQASELPAARVVFVHSRVAPGFRSTRFLCGQSSAYPMRCFKDQRVLPDRSEESIRQLLAQFGLHGETLNCDVFPPLGASTTSSITCTGYGYLGRYAVSVEARSGGHKSPLASGTQVSLTLIHRVLR